MSSSTTPEYASFFAVMGASAAMVFSGEHRPATGGAGERVGGRGRMVWRKRLLFPRHSPAPAGRHRRRGLEFFGPGGAPLRSIRALGGGGGSVPVTSPPAEPPGPCDCGGAARAVPPHPLVLGSRGSGSRRWPRGAPWWGGCRASGAGCPRNPRASACPGLRGGASPTVNRMWLVFKPFLGQRETSF